MYWTEQMRHLSVEQKMNMLRDMQNAYPYREPPPGPTRHPVVTESDVTWFIWTYAMLLLAGGAALGTVVTMMVMR